MNRRKVHYIDVSKMTKKECCETLGISYVPWYKDSLFLLMLLVFSAPYVATVINIFRN